MIIDQRGEIPHNNVAINYREMCQIHETVNKKQLVGMRVQIPWVPVVPRKLCHGVQLAAPLPHAPGVRMT